MITIGIDPHKRSHTAAAADAATGELLDTLTVATDLAGHARLIDWARAMADECRFALEDCRHVSGRLERELLARGERVVRVPPRLMGQARRSQRESGKSDPIDALAVARAALREPGLPAAHLDREARELKLLLDTARTWSPSAPLRSSAFAGICTTSRPDWSRTRARCAATRRGARSPGAWLGASRPSRSASPASCWRGSGRSPAASETCRSRSASAWWPTRLGCSRCRAARS